MENNIIAHTNELISVFENGSYDAKHIDSLLQYLVAIFQSDETTFKAVLILLRNCKKEIVKEPLVNLLKNSNTDNQIKAALLAVCWESGLDYSDYLNVFIPFLINDNADDITALEASTIITEMETVYNKKDLLLAIKTIHQTEQEKYSVTRRVIINDTLQHLILLNSK